MQHGTITTRDRRLTAAAETVELSAACTARILRESRFEVWEEIDEASRRSLAEWFAETEVDWLSLILGEEEAQQYAQQYANRRVVGRLTLPAADDGAWNAVIDDYDLILHGLRQTVPALASFGMTEAHPNELPAVDPESPVQPRPWMRLCFRSEAERRIAEALDAENVMFAANPSVRVGVTQDHRESREPDFFVVHEGKTGVLEVDGPWHDGRAEADHERDRRFKEHGIRVVERYPSDRCYEMPGRVVTEFLRLLDLNG